MLYLFVCYTAFLFGSWRFWELIKLMYPENFNELPDRKAQFRIMLVPFMFMAYAMFFSFILLLSVGVDPFQIVERVIIPSQTPQYFIHHISP